MTTRISKIKAFALSVLLVAVGFAGSEVLTTTRTVIAQEGNGGVMPIRTDGSSVFADVADQVRPGVVFIKTERAESSDDERRGPYDFFRDFLPDQQRHPRRDRGGGSGFVFDKEGRILTNYHVVREADKITVVMASGDDQREYDAEVVGVDPMSDVAIIKIDPPAGLRVVLLGDSDALRVGDWVMAIGTPFGQLQGTATVGIVSAKGRNDLNIMGGQETIYQNYIQTDASINFGNSGGPLVNTHGEAIGINTAINPSGQGIGFAIPINMVKKVMDDLIETGKVTYGYMGIAPEKLNKDLAAGLGLNIDSGILVGSVMAGSPADKAGLEQGDVITTYNDIVVTDDDKFRLLVGNTKVGATVPLKVHRGGKERKLSIKIGERPETQAIAGAPQESGDEWLGLEVGDAADQDNRRRYQMERGQEGVVVLEVSPGSPADEAGIREGDVITEVFSRDVKDLKDYVKISGDLESRKEPIAFLVKRGRSTRYVSVFPEGR